MIKDKPYGIKTQEDYNDLIKILDVFPIKKHNNQKDYAYYSDGDVIVTCYGIQPLSSFYVNKKFLYVVYFDDYVNGFPITFEQFFNKLDSKNKVRFSFFLDLFVTG